MVNTMDTPNGQDVLFTDPDLQALWATAVEQDRDFERIRKAVTERAQKFPKELELHVSIAECDLDDHGRLWYHE
jgi:hypothetical protein